MDPEKEDSQQRPSAEAQADESERQQLSSPSPPCSIPPPPDGGLVAWLQVAGAFFLFFDSWGIINTFGVYQTYYEDVLLRGHSASSISWIGTVQGFLLLLGGLVVGPVIDKGHLKSLVAAGTFLVVFGLMMTSLATEFYQVFLAHGLVVGLGCACLFLPSVAVVATYFTTRRAVALGITASGGSVGSVIYPIMFHRLIGPLGFGWTTRVMAFVALGCLAFSLAVMRVRVPPPRQARPLVDMAAFAEAPFMVFGVGLFFAFVGLYFPFFYLPTYFSSFLHDADGSIAFYIIAITNAASVFGRIVPGLLADRVGPLNAFIPVGLTATVLAFAWIGIRNIAGTIVFAVLYGFASGAVVSLPPSIVAQLTPNMSLLGTRMGMCFTFSALGLLIGNPIAGALLDIEHAVFWKAQLFCAIMLAASMALMIGLWLLMWKRAEGWKL